MTKDKDKKSSFLKRIAQAATLGSLLYALYKKAGKTVYKAATKLVTPVVKVAQKMVVRPLVRTVVKVSGKSITKVIEKFSTKAVGTAVAKEGTKVVEKQVGKVALEKGAEAVTRLPLTKKVVEKIGEKTLEKTGSKLIGKGIATALKKIPVVSLLVGAGFAINRALKGDYTGAGLELASGALATLPVGGTAASLGMDVAIIGRDIAQGR